MYIRGPAFKSRRWTKQELRLLGTMTDKKMAAAHRQEALKLCSIQTAVPWAFRPFGSSKQTAVDSPMDRLLGTQTGS